MGLLLYKSDEMFSATQLIRQSKMIFDKVVKNEIEKAIILRDGKPGFLLMDFAKYEKEAYLKSELEILEKNTKKVSQQLKEIKYRNKKIKLTKKKYKNKTSKQVEYCKRLVV